VLFLEEHFQHQNRPPAQLCRAILFKTGKDVRNIQSDLSRRLRYEAARLPNKFSENDELFQLLTEAAEALDSAQSLTLRLQEAAVVAETTYDRNFSALFREAARTIEDLQAKERASYLNGRRSAFLEVLGCLPKNDSIIAKGP
jgi:hypothetical protein